MRVDSHSHSYSYSECWESNNLSFQVRAIKLVNEAHDGGTLPPEIDIPSLSGRHQKPLLSEPKAVLDLQFLVHFLEYKFLRRSNTEKSWGVGAKHLLDDSPSLFPTWKGNFDRTAYMFFIAGAVLARAYQEPFYKAKEEVPYFKQLGLDVN